MKSTEGKTTARAPSEKTSSRFNKVFRRNFSENDLQPSSPGSREHKLGRASTGNSYLVNPGARSEQASRPVRSAFEWVFKQAFSAKEICPKTLNDFNRPKSSNITHCSFGDEFGKTRLNLHQRSGYFNKKVSNMNWPFMDRKRSLIRKTSATKRMGSYINLSDLDPKWTGVDSQQKPEDTPQLSCILKINPMDRE
jgi:hypothetical protein